MSDQRGRPHLHTRRIAQRVKGEAIAETVAGDGGQLIAGIAVTDTRIAAAYGSQLVIVGMIGIGCCDIFGIDGAGQQPFVRIPVGVCHIPQSIRDFVGVLSVGLGCCRGGYKGFIGCPYKS